MARKKAVPEDREIAELLDVIRSLEDSLSGLQARARSVEIQLGVVLRLVGNILKRG